MRLGAFLLASALFAAEPAKLPEPFRSLADLASTAPPEFNADALLRIDESGKLADKNARREIVDQAFQLAASAKFAVRMEGLAGTTADTASGSLSQAYALKLDALSLESRAVEDMVPIDPAHARELFTQIPKPALAALTCDDALSYEPSAYYQALSAVVNGGFNAKEKAKDLHFNLLADSLGQAASPSELAPLASAIASAGVTAQERQLLWARFNGLLENMQPDERSFGASLPALFAVNTPIIQAALDKYQHKNHGCETDSASAGLQSSAGPQSAGLQSAGLQSAKGQATPKLDPYWQSANAQQLLQAGKQLRVGTNGQLLSEADRATLEWQQDLADYLNLIADWSADQEKSPAIYYHEKCLVYTSLLDLVPAGPQSDKILADFVDFIANSDLYQQSPAEWFVEPHSLLDRAKTNSAMLGKELEAFHRSGNPVLVLEVTFQKAFAAGASTPR
jgi:hypothetical protein